MVDYGVAKIERVASAPVAYSALAQTVDPFAWAGAVLPDYAGRYLDSTPLVVVLRRDAP